MDVMVRRSDTMNFQLSNSCTKVQIEYIIGGWREGGHLVSGIQSLIVSHVNWEIASFSVPVYCKLSTVSLIRIPGLGDHESAEGLKYWTFTLVMRMATVNYIWRSQSEAQAIDYVVWITQYMYTVSHKFKEK